MATIQGRKVLAFQVLSSFLRACFKLNQEINKIIDLYIVIY